MSRKIFSQRKFPTPPVAKLIGFRLIQARKGKAICEMQAGEKHVNTIGTVHGGILCDLSDAAMGFAFLSLLPVHQVGVTTEFRINFLAPAHPGDRLKATAKTLSRGKSLYYVECEVRNGRKRLVAKTSCTCKVINKRKC